jgi:hypothetical protein
MTRLGLLQTTDLGSMGSRLPVSGKAEDLGLIRTVQDAATRSEGWVKSPSRLRADVPFQYPAMMAPAMQADILDALLEADQSIRSVLDPFVGAGTVMMQAISRGIDFYGQDINPMSILLCEARSTSLDPLQLREEIDLVLLRVPRHAEADESAVVRIPNAHKWFQPLVLAALLALAEAIRQCDSQKIRRVLWVALAETVRLASNSRTSTFKLHIRSDADIATRTIDPIRAFESVTDGITQAVAQRLSDARGSSSSERESRQIRIEVHRADTIAGALGSFGPYDALITSPPYGDNLSTVPYGQHSYLPLHFIDPEDVPDGVPADLLRTTQEIDRRSLGGHWVDIARATKALDYSPAFKSTMQRLAAAPLDRARRVAAFSLDLADSIPAILSALKPGAFMAWTIGNRTVAGQPVPTDQILVDTLERHGCTTIGTVERTIPSTHKHMATRNSLGSTISTELVVLARNGN